MVDVGTLAGALVATLCAGIALGAGHRRFDTAVLIGTASPASLEDLSGEHDAVIVEGDLRLDAPAPDPFADEADADAALLRWHHEEGIDRTHAAGLASGRIAIDDGTGLAVLDTSWLEEHLAISPSEPSSRSIAEDDPHVTIDAEERVRSYDVEDALPAALSEFLEARGVEPHPYRSQEFRYRRVPDGQRVVVVAEFTDADGRPRLRGSDATPMLLATGQRSAFARRVRATTWGLLGAGALLGVAALWLAATGLGLV